jgi:hypothetical protein
MESFWLLRTADFDKSDLCPNLAEVAEHDRTVEDLKAVCAREPRLDYMVLLAPVSGATAKVWVSPVPFSYAQIDAEKVQVNIHKADHFYIYSCASFLR